LNLPTNRDTAKYFAGQVIGLVRYIDENGGQELTVQEPPPTAYLTLMKGGRLSHSFPLRGTVTVGRDKTNGVVTADQKVSRHHATLTPIDDTFILNDQGSANGTYINGVLIAQPTRLKDNDKVSFGDTIFLYSLSKPDSAIFEVSAPPIRPVAVPSPQVAGSGPLPHWADSNVPLWAIVGCMALVIIGLLLLITLLLGIFLGRSQLGVLTGWYVVMATGLI
jgi:hypothetical protein